MNNLRIIFEGADLAGKTTLSKLLAKVLGCAYRGRIVRSLDSVQAHLQDQFHTSQGLWILDRCYPISDLIYEPLVAARSSPFASETVRASWMMSWLESTPLIVFVDCDDKTLKQRYDQRGDDLQRLDTILAAAESYRQFFKTCKIPYLAIDTSGEGYDSPQLQKHLRSILRYLTETRLESIWFEGNTLYYGREELK